MGNPASRCSEELKQAVAVSEEKSSSVPEGAANFPAAVFLAGKCPILGRDSISFNSVHTRCIVKTGGFTGGVCKNRGFIKFKGFPVEFLENRRS